MANELVESEITKQDIRDIDIILRKAGKPLPILREKDTDVSFLPVTEEFLKGIVAGKKRLKSRGLQVEIKASDVLKASLGRSDSMKVIKEGLHRIGYLDKCCNKSTIYQREEKEVSRFEDSCWTSYYIRKEQAGNYRVSSVYNSSGVYFGREREFTNADMKEISGIILVLLIVLFWAVPGVYLIFYFIKAIFQATTLKDILLGLLLMIISGGTLLGLAVKNAAYLRWWPIAKSKRMRSRKVTAKLLEKAPEFCLEKFLGILNSKLLRVLYAEGVEEIGDIISCDMTQFLQEQGDVVNCEFNNFWFTGMQEDEDYMYLDVIYGVTLDRDWGTAIHRGEQMIHLQLASPIQGIMESDLYHDWSIVKIETQKN